MNTYTLSITFNLRLRPSQLFGFRGAFIDMAAGSGVLSDDELSFLSNRIHTQGVWHTHTIERYPRIHYRWDNGNAQLWAIGEGVAVIKKIINSGILEHFVIEETSIPLHIIRESEKEKKSLYIMDQKKDYLLFHYIPYADGADSAYHTLTNMYEKVNLLTTLIKNGLIMAASSLGNEIADADKANVIITDIIHKEKAKYIVKDKATGKRLIQRPLSYFIRMKSDMAIPDGFAIGQHKALGYGVIQSI